MSHTIEQYIIYHLVSQHCLAGEYVVSNGLGADAVAMRYLSKVGLLEIHDECGRMVKGKLQDAPPPSFPDLDDLEE